MSWTYDTTQFNSSVAGSYSGSTIGERYQVRFLVQDIHTARQLFEDEEIDWAVSTEENVYTAAASLCDVLVSRANGVKSKKISDFSIIYDIGFYETRGAMLRARGAGHQMPYAGGISSNDKQAQRNDPDWVAPSFARNLDENPAAPKPSQPPINPLITI